MQAVLGQGTFKRREMDIEDYVGILRRNSGWLIGPIMAGIVIATVVACFWPNTYVSNAIIKIVPPTVPARLVPNNVDVSMTNRVTQLRTELMSHANLTNVIRTYGLYQKEQMALPLEDIIESMKKLVKIDPLMVGLGADARATAIVVSFSNDQRFKAQAVTKYFVTKIIDENSRDASSRSKMMTNFVQEKFNEAEAKLQAADNAIVAFKQSNLGRMPEELTGNAQLMMSYDTRSSMLNQKLTTIRNDVTMLEGELRGWITKRSAAAEGGGSGSASSGGPLQALTNSDPVLGQLNAAIAQMERDKAKLLLEFTPKYPDVIKLERLLEIAKQERDERMNSRLALPAAAKRDDASTAARNDVRPKSKDEADAEAQISRIQSKLKALGNEEEQVIRDISSSEKRAADVQALLRNGPAGQQQYADLLRDQMAARKDYEQWKGNLTISKTASDLQDNKQGETLEILDGASLPTNPTSPNRPLFLGMGLFSGIFVGAGLIAFREIRDTSIKSLKDVQAYTQFNVLGSVPLLENDMVVRRRRRMGILGWASASLVSIITMAGATYYYLNVISR